jgi:GTP-sensing pleiotropic transcriptional regulator CodY
MEWNANGLLWLLHALEVIVSTENIDICVMSGTHFPKESFIRFKYYVTCHTILLDNAARGGNYIIIRNNTKLFEEENYVTRDIQATIVITETSKPRLTVKCNLMPTKI